MVDLVNLTRCEKISRKMDKLKHSQQIQNDILSLSQKDLIRMRSFFQKVYLSRKWIIKRGKGF